MSSKIKRKTASKKQLLDINNQLQRALSLHRAGHLDQAAEIYRKIIAIQPNNGDTLNLFGTLALQKKEYPRAITLLKKAVALYPKQADYLSNFGSANKEVGQLKEAESAYKRAISLQPDHLGAMYNLAGVLALRQKPQEAEKMYQDVLLLKPRMPEALIELGNVYLAQQKFPEAINSFEKVLLHTPNNITAYCAIGTALQAEGKITESLQLYQRALKILPTEAIFHNDMANSLSKLGRLHEALNAYQKALKYNPTLRNAYINLAWTFREHGQLEESLECLNTLRTKFKLSPQDHSDLLFSLNYGPSFNSQELLKAATEWWEFHGKQHCNTFSHPPRPADLKRLKIGFVSPDFSKHPVGYFLIPLFREINPQKVEIFCYAQMSENQGDEVTINLKKRVDHWQSIFSLSDEAAAEKIFTDQIDILIDLAGHTANNRLMVFARKPAPVQINWLGYVNTTGLENMDYRLTDNIVDPEGETISASETIYRLPDCFFCYAPHEISPDDEPEPPASKNGFITLGSFNNLPKITPEVIELWAKIMTNLPKAKLLFTSRQFKDNAIIDRYKNLFTNAGIDPEQIIFHGSLPLQEYLSLIRSVDIALDPFPHNGHTITCDTLWMGVPVITLRGDRYAGRMTASALTAIGLSDFIAVDKDDYMKKTVDLASNIDQLRTIRREMRQRIMDSPMYDQKRFARDFEKALWDIWRKQISHRNTQNHTEL